MFRTFLRTINIIFGDWICLLLNAYFKWILRGGETDRIKKILIIKMAGIGDAVLMLPAIKKIREKYKDAEINVLASYLNRQVFDGDPAVNHVLKYDFVVFPKGLTDILKYSYHVRKNKYDVVIDMEHFFPLTAILAFLAGAPVRVGFYKGRQRRKMMFSSPREFDEKKHMLENYEELVAGALPLKSGEIKRVAPFISDENREGIRSILTGQGVQEGDFVVCISPGASGMRKIKAIKNNRALLRMWPLDNLIAVIKWMFGQYKVKVIITGSFNERIISKAVLSQAKMDKSIVDLTGMLSLKEYFALLERVDLFMGNDSGPSHVVYALDKPSIIFYGPETPVLYGPRYTKNGIALYKNIACSPCIKIYLGKRAYQSGCARPKCLEAISVNEVKNIIVDLFAKLKVGQKQIPHSL